MSNDRESIYFGQEISDRANDFVVTTGPTMPPYNAETMEAMISSMEEFKAKRDQSDLEFFKAILRYGITVMCSDYIEGRNMILTVPSFMKDRLKQAVGELKQDEEGGGNATT